MFFSSYVKGVLFFNGRYKRGVPFLSKMVYKRVRGWSSGLSIHRSAVLTKILDMDSRK